MIGMKCSISLMPSVHLNDNSFINNYNYNRLRIILCYKHVYVFIRSTLFLIGPYYLIFNVQYHTNWWMVVVSQHIAYGIYTSWNELWVVVDCYCTIRYWSILVSHTISKCKCNFADSARIRTVQQCRIYWRFK